MRNTRVSVLLRVAGKFGPKYSSQDSAGETGSVPGLPPAIPRSGSAGMLVLRAACPGALTSQSGPGPLSAASFRLFVEVSYYGLSCVPRRHVEVLTLSTYECDSLWKQSLQR